MTKYNQHTWLRQIDAAITAKASVQHVTKQGKTVTLTMSISAGFIAYHLAEKRADWETGTGVYCSQAKLAEEFGMSRQTISNVFIILEKLGFFVRDLSKEKTGGTNYYDLAIPDHVFSQDMGVLSQDRGCLVAGQGVSSHETQTANRTTQLTDKEKTKVSRPAAGAAPPLENSPIENREVSPIDNKDEELPIDKTESAGGVFSQDRVPVQRVRSEFDRSAMIRANAEKARQQAIEAAKEPRKGVLNW